MILLGFDIGSSSVKASLVEAETGQCIASAFYPKQEAPIIFNVIQDFSKNTIVSESGVLCYETDKYKPKVPDVFQGNVITSNSIENDFIRFLNEKSEKKKIINLFLNKYNVFIENFPSIKSYKPFVFAETGSTSAFVTAVIE